MATGSLFGQNNLTKYDHYFGKLAGQPIRLVLNQDNQEVKGIYYYEKYKTPIDLVVMDSNQADNKWVLTEKYKGKDISKSNPQWMVEVKNGRLIGEWKDLVHEKSYPIELVKDAHPSLAFKNIVLKKTYKFPQYRMKKEEDHIYTVQTFYDYDVLEAIETTPTAIALNQLIKGKMYIDKNLPIEEGLYKEFKRMNTAIEKEAQERVAVNGDLYGMHWEKGMQMKILFNKNDLLELGFSDEGYGGGAHGDFSKESIVFDLRRNRKMELTELFIPMTVEVEEEFRTLLKNRFEEVNRKKIEEIIFADKLQLPTKFSLKEEGINFIYGTYEIAAFVYGIIEIYVSYEDLYHLLRQDFIKRMNLQDLCN